jgi:alpha-tubulin suppressor-like RCC1 family protein
MVQLDVGRDGHVWALGSDGTVYYREGITVDNHYGTSWEAQPRDSATTDLDNVANEIAVCTNGNVWMIGTDDKLYYRMRITEEN